jgi:tetratricopeptide (TPR) repeat protein
VAVFVIFMVFTVTLFRSGESIRWKKELAEVDAHFAAGRFDQAADGLLAFGRKWTGAQSTFDWNRKMGEYFAAAGRWQVAAQFYERAAAIRPGAAGVAARAGEAWFHAKDPAKAREWLSREINTISAALGDHDRAHLYLGLILWQEGKPREAMEELAAVADRAKWAAQMDPVYTAVREKYLDPAAAPPAAP